MCPTERCRKTFSHRSHIPGGYGGARVLDLDLCERVLAADRRLRFLLPVHLYGHAIDLERLERLRERFSLRIVEDCAQAIGAQSRGVPVGSIGDFSATSFYPTKNLGCLGDGGALLTRNAEGAELARVLRDYGQSDKFEHTHMGLNSRLDELQAAVLRRVFLPELARLTCRRSEIAECYGARIHNSGLATPPRPVGAGPNSTSRARALAASSDSGNSLCNF